MKRKLLGGELIEVYEEITSTRSWIAPRGCKSVDVFVVGGGDNGRNADAYYSGNGGRAGECKTYNSILVIPGQSFSCVVGGIGQDSYSLNSSYIARGKMGAIGGTAASATYPNAANGNPGQDGVYAFNNPVKFPKKMGASGGGGSSNSYPSQSTVGGAGGYYGGGVGGRSAPGVNQGENGSNATWYGGSGGGAGKSCNDANLRSYGGEGYQGIVILHYWKYK